MNNSAEQALSEVAGRAWEMPVGRKLISGLVAHCRRPWVAVVSLGLLVSLGAVGPLGQGQADAASSEGVWAWGDNSSGQLGDGTVQDRTGPVRVSGLAKATGITAGTSSGYAIKPDGTVWAWGKNAYGQLGDGTYNPSLTPVQVSGLSNVTRVFAEGFSAYALKADGSLWAWGSNIEGQLGNGTKSTETATPARILGLPTVTNIITSPAGKVVYALTAEGTVWAWGRNGHGQLGIGTTVDSLTPVRIPQLSGIASIASATDMDLASGYALTTEGTVWAWGSNGHGQLGIGTTVDSLTPVKIPGLTGITKITSARTSVYALQAGGRVWVWGTGYDGELGDGISGIRSTPWRLPSPTNIIDITAGASGSSGFALRNDGTVWAWGNNGSGQVGDGSWGVGEYPAQASGLSNVTSITVSPFGHSVYATKTGGTVWAWGSNSHGQLGDGTINDRHLPVQISALTNVTNIVATDSSAYAVVSSVSPNDGRVVKTTPAAPSKKATPAAPSKKATRPNPSSTATGAPQPIAPALKALRAPVKKVFVKAGRTLKVTVVADAVPGRHGRVKLAWKATNPKKAKVTIKGGKPGKRGKGMVTVKPGKPIKIKIKAKRVGKVMITLTAPNGVKYRVKAQIVKKGQVAKGLKIKAKGLKKKTGKYTLKVKFNAKKPVDLKVRPVPFRHTSAHAVFKAKGAVRVDPAGRVTAKRKGKAKITVKLGSRKTVIRVRVK